MAVHRVLLPQCSWRVVLECVTLIPLHGSFVAVEVVETNTNMTKRCLHHKSFVKGAARPIWCKERVGRQLVRLHQLLASKVN